MSIAATIEDVDLDTESVRELTAFQRNVLTVLAEGPTYGLAIKEELEAYYGDDVNHGRLYPNLDSLVEMGLVEKGELDKRTNEYKLTDAGFAALRDQLEWTFSRIGAGENGTADIETLLRNVE
jgi:DNA-binding PadR family transcriptional regulator